MASIEVLHMCGIVEGFDDGESVDHVLIVMVMVMVIVMVMVMMMMMVMVMVMHA